jgi:hypothetical protein
VSEEQHVALPHLYGAPAYSRPPRPVETLTRPFDMDELPLEAERTEDDVVLLAEQMGTSLAPAAIIAAKPGRRLRFGRSHDESAPAETEPVAVAGPAGGTRASDAQAPTLEGRPFRLRSLGKIFGSDQK